MNSNTSQFFSKTACIARAFSSALSWLLAWAGVQPGGSIDLPFRLPSSAFLFFALLIAPCAMLSTAHAAECPQWWGDRSVTTSAASTNNFAAVNAGQLKWIATQAAAEFNANLPGGSGVAISSLVAGFLNTNNHVAVNVGQVKAMAKPFYDRLIELGIANSYPWTASTADDRNYALANIGQVKNVFKFDVPGVLPDVIDNQIAFSGETWQFQLPDDVLGLGSNTLYSACFADGSPLPDAMSIDPGRGAFEWAPAGKSGLYRIMVRGADGSANSIISSFYLTVLDKISEFTDRNKLVAIDGNHAVGSGSGGQCGVLNTYQYDGSQWTRAAILTNSFWAGATNSAWSYYDYGYWTDLDLLKNPGNRRIAASYNAKVRSSYRTDSFISSFTGPCLTGERSTGSSIHLSSNDAIPRDAIAHVSGTNIVYLNYFGVSDANVSNPTIINKSSGNAMDLDGNTAIVGSNVYVRSGTNWSLQCALPVPNPAWPAIQGDTAFVSGKFFARSGSNWVEEADLGEVPSERPELKGNSLVVKVGSSPKVYKKIKGQWISMGSIPWPIDGLDLSDDQVVVLGRDSGGTLFVQLNVAPVAVADAYTCPGNGSLRVDSARGVLANDTDKNENVLLAELVEMPIHGYISLSSDGSFTYTPQTGYIGSDSFTYRAFDGEYYSASATVTINVARDSDGDGMPDEWETAKGLDPNSGSDAFDDADGDGICNLLEFQLGTDPNHADPSSLIEHILAEQRITSRIVFPEFTARMAAAGETVAAVLISANRVLDWDNFYISRDEAGSLAAKLHGLQLMINNQPVTFAGGDKSTLVTAYVPEGSTSVELALVALTNGLVSAEADTRWVKWDPTVRMIVTRTADTNDIYVAGIDEMHEENYIEVKLSIAEEPPIPGSYRLIAQASSSGAELLVSSTAGDSTVEFVGNTRFNETTLSLYGNGSSSSHKGTEFLLRSGKGEKDVAKPLKVTVFDVGIDAESLFTVVRKSEDGSNLWNVLFGNIDVDLCAESPAGGAVTGLLTLSEYDGSPINGISRIATNAGLHYFEIGDSTRGDRMSAEWEVKGQTARIREDGCSVYANLAGFDALTAAEVTDGLEDSRGVLVCFTNESPAARIIAHSAGVGGGAHVVKKHLWFSDASKVRLYRNGSEIDLIDNSVNIDGDDQATFTVVRDDAWAWNEEVMVSMSLSVSNGVSNYYIGTDSLLLVPSKVNIAVDSDSENVDYMDTVVFTGGVLPEQPVESWTWTIIKGQGDPATSVSNILATAVKNAVGNRFKIQARATIYGAEFFGEKEITAIIPQPDLTFDSLWEEASWRPSGAPTETDPGGGLRVNSNDDDGECGVDLSRDVVAPPLVAADPDLKHVGVAMYPVLSVGTVSLDVPPSIRTWYSSRKGGVVPPAAHSMLMEKRTWDLTNQQDRADFISLTSGGFWIEGLSKGSNPVTLSYENGLRSDTVRINTITADLRGYDARRTMELDYVLEQDEENGVLVAVNDDTPGLDPHEAKTEVSAVGRSGLSRQLRFYGSYEKLLVNGATPLQVMQIPGDSNVAVEYEISISDSWDISDTARAELVVTDSSDPYNPKSWTDAVTFNILRIDMIPDFNHDRIIDSDDQHKVTDSDPLRFWINDDNDNEFSADSGDDVPGASSYPDWQSVALIGEMLYVDGERDFVDFFPVHMDLRDALNVLDPADYKYVLKHEDGAVNALIDIELTPATADKYLVDQTWCAAHDRDRLEHISAAGYELPATFLKGVVAGTRGVILVEGRKASAKPLVLEIRKASDGMVMLVEKLPLKLSGVEDMFCHVNLADNLDASENQTVTVADRTSPSNLPNNLNTKNFIFVHGYNVSQQAARGWHSEIFKRLFWGRSHAKFTGITWHGDTGQNYHKAVINAFTTSENLADQLSFLSGDTTIAAHSLGNMVVSSAISDHGFAPSRYFMFNAAVAIEAYDGGQITGQGGVNMKNNIRNPDWSTFAERLWASKWHELFEGDSRSRLTWVNRFASIISRTELYNFYSEGEDVVRNADGTVPSLIDLAFVEKGAYAWAMQEMIKGMDGPLGAFAYNLVMPDQHAGWQFNSAYNPGDAATVTDAQLREEPFFERFIAAGVGQASRFTTYDGEKLLAPLGDADANSQASQATTQYKLLAESIPALSFAAAANSVNALGVSRNIHMEGDRDGWPANRLSDPLLLDNWLHSDLKNIAFPYITQFYDRIVNDEGGL